MQDADFAKNQPKEMIECLLYTMPKRTLKIMASADFDAWVVMEYTKNG